MSEGDVDPIHYTVLAQYLRALQKRWNDRADAAAKRGNTSGAKRIRRMAPCARLVELVRQTTPPSRPRYALLGIVLRDYGHYGLGLGTKPLKGELEDLAKISEVMKVLLSECRSGDRLGSQEALLWYLWEHVRWRPAGNNWLRLLRVFGSAVHPFANAKKVPSSRSMIAPHISDAGSEGSVTRCHDAVTTPSTPFASLTESPLRGASLICENGHVSSFDRNCSHCGARIVNASQEALRYLAAHIRQVLFGGSASDAFQFTLRVREQPPSESVSAPRLTGLASAFVVELDGYNAEVHSRSSDTNLGTDIIISRVEMKEADALYDLYYGNRNDSDMLQAFSADSLVGKFRDAVLNTKIGRSINAGKIRRLLAAGIGQEIVASRLTLVNLASKMAHMNGLHDDARSALDQLLASIDSNIRGPGRLTDREALLFSSLLPNLYTSMTEADLGEGARSPNMIRLEQILERVFAAYGRPPLSQSSVRDFDVPANTTWRPWDLVLKCEIYRVLYLLRAGCGLDWIPAGDVVNYVTALACERQEHNPKEALHVLTPISIALLDTGRIKEAAELTEFANSCFNNVVGKGFTAIAQTAHGQQQDRSAEYAIHHICRAQVFSVINDRGLALHNEVLRSCAEVAKTPDDRLGISTFRSVKPELELIGVADQTSVIGDNAILARMRDRNSHRTFFSMPAYARLLSL